MVRNSNVTLAGLESGHTSRIKTRAGPHLSVDVSPDGALQLTVQGSLPATILLNGTQSADNVLVHAIDRLLLPRYVRKRAGLSGKPEAAGVQPLFSHG